MSRLRRAAVIGAVLAVIFVTWAGGPPPLSALFDVFVWLAYAIIALVGAFVGVSVVLACQHAWKSPRWLSGTLVGLVLFSLPVVLPFVRETRETQRFLATADSTMGVVAGKYVRGGVHIIVDYEVGGQTHRIRDFGEIPYFGEPPFCDWKRGDSIPVHYQPATPEVALVGHPDTV